MSNISTKKCQKMELLSLSQQGNEVYIWYGSYVLRKMCMDLLHIQKYRHILHDEF